MGVRQQARRGVMITLIVVGALAMFASTQQDRIWWILVGFLIGMTSLSLLLLQLGDALDEHLAVRVPPWWPWAFGGVALAGLGVITAAIWFQLNPILAIAGMVTLTVGLIGLFLWTGRRSGPPGLATEAVVGPDDVPPPAARIGVGSPTWYGFEAMAIGIGLLLISDGTASLFGVIAWLFGLVVVKVASLPYLASRGRGIHRTVRILIDIALVGLFLLFAGAFTSNSVLLLVGLSIVMAALSMIGIGISHVHCKEGRAWWVIGGSSAAIVAIWGWVAVVTQNPGLAFVFGLIIAVAGGFFVLRGEGIVLLMMVGYVLAWGLVERTSPAAEAAIDPGDRPTIVALGDSFISGEGAAEFFAGTNDAGGNQCRRAPTSHPYLIAEALDAQVLSVACSGAKIGDLILCGQMWPDGRRCRIDGWTDELDEYRDQPAGPLPQIVTATGRGLGDDVDVVLVSIGGNDVGFSSIVKACLLPKGCDERREIWLDNVDLLGPKLDEIYADIAIAFPSAAVMVVPYPMIVKAAERERCDLGLSQGEREFVVDFIQKLDSVIEQAVERAGFVYLSEAVNAYDGFQLCDETAAANHLRLVPPEGDKLGRYSPSTWIPGSMHPNELGHRLTAAAVVCSVAQPLLSDQLTVTIDGRTETCFPALPATGPDESPAEATSSAAAEACEAALGANDVTAADGQESAEACAAVAEAVDTQIGALAAEVAAVSDELVSDDEWIRVELFRTIRALALPLVLLLAAGLTFAWAFVQLNNPLSRFLAQRTDAPRE